MRSTVAGVSRKRFLFIAVLRRAMGFCLVTSLAQKSYSISIYKECKLYMRGIYTLVEYSLKNDKNDVDIAVL